MKGFAARLTLVSALVSPPVAAPCAGQTAAAPGAAGAVSDSPALFTGADLTGADLTGVVQRAGAAGDRVVRSGRPAAYRGDITASLPAPAPGRGSGSVSGHFRFGHGSGLAIGPALAGSANGVASGLADESSFTILAQLFYQLELPLSPGPGPGSGRVALTVGKIDPFSFFDQNVVSDDETSAFLNNVFVHNPLLDTGGDIGGDRYGFAPGVRAAWFSDSRHSVEASLGFIGAGRGAEFRRSPGRPTVIAQVAVAPHREAGAAGNYRLYAWSNPQAVDASGLPGRHAGWGTSVDQPVGRHLTVFGRLGHRTRGRGAFNRAVTVGAEWKGTSWGRPRDGFGVALGRLSGGDSAGRVPADAAPVDASRAEKIAEVFYRYALTDGVEVSPDVQIVKRAAGDPASPTIRVAGLRLKLTF